MLLRRHNGRGLESAASRSIGRLRTASEGVPDSGPSANMCSRCSVRRRFYLGRRVLQIVDPTEPLPSLAAGEALTLSGTPTASENGTAPPAELDAPGDITIGVAASNRHAPTNGHGAGGDGYFPLELRLNAKPRRRTIVGDARDLPLDNSSVDLITTSPPYWRKRDYGHPDQIGQESTAAEYTDAMIACLREWRRVLRPSGSVFLNVGDTFHKRSLAGIPGRVEGAAADDGWIIRNRIIWAKHGGMPEPAQNRLANRHEYVLHLVPRHDYYYDLFGYSKAIGNGANPGDVWRFNPGRHMGRHLAPFPMEIVRRAILLACPQSVCSKCGEPRRRIVKRTMDLDPSRPQAKRAMEIAKEARLSPAHIAAIQATGVSDAGKALKVQNGTGRNAADVKLLAAEAKQALGGYFREFTFARRETIGWTKCNCRVKQVPAVVLDPFMGTGTTLMTAVAMGRSAVGVDLAAPYT
jgi:DNA modification methylase